MFIELVELHKYNRFSLLDIDTLTFTPDNTNMILATNGAGKSSLLSESSPMPPDKNDFSIGGYKKVIVRFNNHRFILHSQDGKHSFIIDGGDELNQGHTLKVQLHLIKEHLHVTPFLMSVIIGEKKFTSMSPNERKDLFSEISSVSYDYAFSVFNKSKSRLRDITGALKIDTVKLSKIEDSMITKLEYDKLIEKQLLYIKLQNDIRTNITNIEIIEDPKIKLKQLISLYKRIESISNKNIIDTDSIDFNIRESKDKLNIVLENISNLKEYVEVDKAQLDSDIIKFSNLVIGLETENVFKEKIEDILSFIDNNHSKLSYYVTNYNDKFTSFKQSDLHSMMDKYKELSKEEDKYKDRLHKLQGEYKVLSDNKTKSDVSCPSCDFVFKVGYSDDNYENVRLNIEDVERRIFKIKELIKPIYERIEEIKLFSTIREDFLFFLSEYNSVYMYLTNGNIETNMNAIRPLLVRLLEIEILNNKLIELHKEKNNITMEDSIKAKSISMQREVLVETANSIRDNVIRYEKNKKDAIRTNNILTQREDIISKISSELLSIKPFVESKIDSVKNKYYKDILNSIDNEMIDISDSIRNYEQTSLLSDTLRNNIVELKNKIVVLKKIVNSLSPNDGIIAKSISGSIGYFLNIANITIKDVWSYPLKIKFDIGDTLTYKFPIDSADSSKSDISKSSSGMKEIINLSCIVAVQNVLGVKLPYYLDEFGSTFDSTHRRNALILLNKLINNGNQLFIISHYQDIITPLIDKSSTIVLDANNVDLANIVKYNDRLKIK